MTLRLRAAALAGTATVLAAGALVGTASTAAQAADPAGVGYSCVTSLSPDPIPVTVGVTGFPTAVTAGKTVPAGPVPVSFTLSRAVLDGMASKGINQAGVSSNDFAMGVGATKVALTGVSVAKSATPASGDMTMTADSKNAPFAAPAAGSYDLTLPTTFNATVDTNLIPLPVACTIVDQSKAKIGTVTSTAPVGPQGSAYSCAIGANPLTVYVDATTVPDFSPATTGSTIPAVAEQIKVNYTIPAASAALLAPATSASFGSGDFGFRIGDSGSSIPSADLTSASGTISAGDDLVLPAESTNNEFTVPAVGTYDLKLPSTFTGSLTTSSSPNASTGTCTIVDDSTSTVGAPFTVTKQSSSTKATAPKSVKKGAAVKVSVTVTPGTASGKVTVKDGSKSVGSAMLANGKATVTVKGLKPGKHTLTASYAGDSSTSASKSKAITVTVKKK
ncbi:Ig-like domain-containing protein [Nocardioides sp. CN2-186]|uniref:Ig-like domain-containing protein n=1 Tax=Nocardioides tweenelious TaxID=3156607 RepID=UPI0032B33B03